MEPTNWWFGSNAFPFPFGGSFRFHGDIFGGVSSY